MSDDLHGAIMNLQIPMDPKIPSDAGVMLAYKLGHRDARHAAAELTLSTPPAAIPAEPSAGICAHAAPSLTKSGERCAPILAQHNGVRTHDRRSEEGNFDTGSESAGGDGATRSNAVCSGGIECRTCLRNAAERRDTVEPDGVTPLKVEASPLSAALLEAVDDVLERAPCDCSHRKRYEDGEHTSGCYLFDLNIARAALSQTMQPQAEPAAGEQAARNWIHGEAIDYLEVPDVQDESGINAHYSRDLVLQCIDAAIEAGKEQAGAVASESRCSNCDDTGDVNSITGEWRGVCHCPAGQAINARALAAPGAAIAAREQEALTACREAFKQIRSHCWPFPLTNDAGKSLSMEKIDKADRLALAALASREEAPATPQALVSGAEHYRAAAEAALRALDVYMKLPADRWPGPPTTAVLSLRAALKGMQPGERKEGV